MNFADVKAAIEQNKRGLAIAGAAGVGGLALLANRRKAAAGDTAGNAAAPAAPTVGYSNYGLAPLQATGAAGGYDSSSSDVYNAIQPQLEALGQMLAKQNETKAPVPVVAPMASTTYAPSYDPNSQYVVYSSGSAWEVMRDGSLFGLTLPQWQKAYANGARAENLGAYNPTGDWWSTQTNLDSRASGTQLAHGGAAPQRLVAGG